MVLNLVFPNEYAPYFAFTLFFSLILLWIYLLIAQFFRRRPILDAPREFVFPMLVGGRLVMRETYFNNLKRHGITIKYLVVYSIILIFIIGYFIFIYQLLK